MKNNISGDTSDMVNVLRGFSSAVNVCLLMVDGCVEVWH